MKHQPEKIEEKIEIRKHRPSDWATIIKYAIMDLMDINNDLLYPCEFECSTKDIKEVECIKCERKCHKKCQDIFLKNTVLKN